MKIVHGVDESQYLFIPAVIIILLWLILILFSIRQYGWKKTIRYFLPVLILAYTAESAGIIAGRYQYSYFIVTINILGADVPLIILMGWSSYLFLFLHLAKNTTRFLYRDHKKSQLTVTAFLTGAYGVLFDLLLDPVAQHNGWWIWMKYPSEANYLGVPLLNFTGWFVFLFYMALAQLLIEKSPLSENRKLLVSFSSLPITGFAMLCTQLIFRFSLRLLSLV